MTPSARLLCAIALVLLSACGEGTVHADLDGDGWCLAPAAIFDARAHSCEGASGFGDCDDTLAEAHPDGAEVCDAVDNDCDGEIDEALDCTVPGCTDPTADNHDLAATDDDGSCAWSGCTDPTADDYDPDATDDDGSCTWWGCTDLTASNYDDAATADDGSCAWRGCTDLTASNYDAAATDDDGSCIYLGCTDPDAANYDDLANDDDGSCLYSCTEEVVGVHASFPVATTLGAVGPLWQSFTLAWSEELVWIEVLPVDRPNGLVTMTVHRGHSDSGPVIAQADAAGFSADDTIVFSFDDPPHVIVDEVYTFALSGSDGSWELTDGDYGVGELFTPADGSLAGDLWFATALAECDGLPSGGCTDPTAGNYDAEADVDDGSCASACTPLGEPDVVSMADAGVATSFSGSALWQTFTATRTGAVTRVEAAFDAAVTGAGVVTVRQGSGTAGAVLGTGELDYGDHDGWFGISTSGIEVVSGETYTLDFSLPAGSALQTTLHDAYDGGSFTNAAGIPGDAEVDLRFRVFVATNCD